AADGSIQRLDLATGKELPSLPVRHTGPVLALAVGEGGSLASGGADGSILLWDLATGQPRATLKGHTQPILSLCFTRDARALAPGAGHPWTLSQPLSPGEVKVWDLAELKQRLSLPGHRGGVCSVSFNADGTSLLTGCEDGHLRVWDAGTGKPILDGPL